jgi:ABC-type Fe3+ transport system permease subunit
MSFSELFSVLLLGGGNVLTFSMLMYPAMTNSQWGTGAVMGTLFLLIHLGLFLLADHWVRRSFSGTDYLF